MAQADAKGLKAWLDMLAKGQIAQLRRRCGVDEEDMADMIRELRRSWGVFRDRRPELYGALVSPRPA